MRHDLLADALSAITNAAMAGKNNCIIKPSSKLINKIIEIFKREGFIADFKVIPNSRGGVVEVLFNGKMNKCAAVKPRFSTKKEEIESFEKRFLPAKDFGLLIVSTPKGLFTHQEIKEAGVGGKLIAYVY